MGLLATKDPRYWLAKIIAEPDKRIYSKEAVKEIFTNVMKMTSAANLVAQTATSSAYWQFWSGNDLDAIILPFVNRASAFGSKYSKLIQAAGNSDSVVAPDLKADAIEMLTYCAATIDGVRHEVRAESSEFQVWVEGVGSFAAAIYKAIAGTVKAIVAGAGNLLTYAVIAVAGVWALGAYMDYGRSSHRRRY